MTIAYAELQVTSNYSFLRGASHPEELVLTARVLGHAAIGIADCNTLAGVARAHVAAEKGGIKLVVGSRLVLEDGPDILCYPTDRAAYGRLARLLTLGKRRAGKGQCRLTLADLTDSTVFAGGAGQKLLAVPPAHPDAAFAALLTALRKRIGKNLYLIANNLYRGDDATRLANLAELAAQARTPLVAANDVHMHTPARRALADVLACIREHCTIRQAGFRLAAHAERHLKPPAEMARLFAAHPETVARSAEIAAACAFSLDELRYEYPADPVPDGRTPQQELERLTWQGAAERYPEGLPARVRDQIAEELGIVGQLGYAPYFLTVNDIVRFARSRSILCQGRGSAANSAVCYALGITAVDPEKIDLLFARFVSSARNEPPDIDVDFEHERREEVIQYIYTKYGRDRSGMTATHISYRTRSALRDVGKVMGLSEDSIIALQGVAWRRSAEEIDEAAVRAVGLDPADRTVRQCLRLAAELTGFPRHLSQHTGGMVMTMGPLCELVPIENAAMDDRTVIEWDKNDLDALGILKIDVLGLGMLSCIRRAFGLIERHHGRPLSLATLPKEDPAVYAMLQKADAVGVFQVESRAQMSMLPRLKPATFYDLVVEVAIVRPGPIQGDMVHPYLRRRQGKEPVESVSPELDAVLAKTYGVPLFQEQAMKIAIVGAGFSAAEADRLRRSMAAFRRFGEVNRFRESFVAGMIRNGYKPDFAERCFKQIEGFADYGFPESHAASFAVLVYASAWLKRHYPAAFACALLNSQPMGFYAPAQIVRDAREHGVEVRAADVNDSDWDCSLEDADGRSAALRLGLRQVKGLMERDAEALVAARGDGYRSIAALQRRAGLSRAALEALARGDAYGSLNLGRREALWAVRGLEAAPQLPLFAAAEKRGSPPASREPAVSLPPMILGEQVAEDYRSLRLSLRAHPLAVLRGAVAAAGYGPCSRLYALRHGQRAAVAGLVTARQQPGSAKGVIFATLEDETAIGNVIVWPDTFEKFRHAVLGSRIMGVTGTVQREGIVVHLLADRIVDLSHLLDGLDRSGPDAAHLPAGDSIRIPSRDFH